MKIELRLPQESTHETMAFIEEHRADGATPKVNLSECKIYCRGKYLILEFNGQVHYWEHEGNYCYLEDAVHFMNPDKPAKWKTLDKLITFRQAIRENWAQGMNLEDLLKENISERAFKELIQTARIFDKRHHGQVTF